jgi:hypothetical protein
MQRCVGTYTIVTCDLLPECQIAQLSINKPTQQHNNRNHKGTFSKMDPIILYASGLVIYEVLRTLEQNRVAMIQMKTDLRLKTQPRQ